MSLLKSKMPKSVYFFHGIQISTTFSYAVLYSSLMIYLTRYVHFPLTYASSMVGLFIAINFALHLLSGYIGRRLVNNRLLFVSCILFKIAGLYVLNWPDQAGLYIGLSLFLVGAGINVTCYNCMFIQQFSANFDESLRETAFFHNYCAMNIGFFLGFLASGYFDLQDNYPALLGLANGSNILTLILVGISWKYLDDKDLVTTTYSSLRLKGHQFLGFLLLLILVPVIILAFKKADVANNLVLLLGSLVIFYITHKTARQKNRIEKNKMVAYLILTVASVIFWMLCSMGPIGITNFIKNNVDKVFWGHLLAVQWITNLNAIFVIIGAPLLAILFTQLRRRGYEISIAKQFSAAMVASAMSFFCLALGVFYADDSGLINIVWVVLHFFMQSLGELLIAPVGFAMIGKLAPPNFQGIMMGLWLMVPGIAASLSQYLSNNLTHSESLAPLITNPDYFNAFSQYGACSVLAALVLLFLSSRVEGYVKDHTLGLTGQTA